MTHNAKGRARALPEDRAARAARQWQHERPDLDPFSMALLGRLGEFAQRVMRERLQPVFARHGLLPGEFDVLATLRRAGPPYALTAGALSDAALISTGGMTSRVDGLAKRGLIERRAHPDDRRAVMVALTPSGRRLIDGVLDEHVRTQQQVLAVLSPAEQARLDTLLRRLLAGLGDEAD